MIEAQYGEDIYLNCYEQYDKTSLHKLFGDLYAKLDEAEQAGFKNPYVVFESTIDAYDPYPGPVEIKIMGDRALTQAEEDAQAYQKKVEALAKELGVTFYEASVVNRLKEEGKIK